MFWLGISLLCILLPNSLEAYPVNDQAPAELSDPADYPDLTSGLSNAEIEATLNDLSLGDLNSLDKLLDENGNEIAEHKNASPGAKHHRESKSQQENIDFEVNPVDDEYLGNNCREEEDEYKEKEASKCTEEPKSTKKCTTTCSTTTPTTTSKTTCPSTEKCTTKSMDLGSKRKMGGFLDDDFNMSSCAEKAKLKKCKKTKPKCDNVCDVNDAECLQRNLDRLKQQKTNLQDYNIDDVPNSDSDLPLDYDLEDTELKGLDQPLDPLKPKKELDDWDEEKMDLDKSKNMDANWDSNDYKVAPKMRQTWSPSNSEPEEEQPSIKQTNDDDPLERERKGAKEESEKSPTKQEKQDEDDMPSDEQPQQEGDNDGKEKEQVADTEQEIIDGESFIAQNARDPPRYLIQSQNGDYFQSDNESSDQQLHAEDQKQCQKYEVDSTDEKEQLYFQSQIKRNKRENKQLDDAPENDGESYFKKLMDSFPRDQGSQSNVNIALREEWRPHLRVKRS
ncbi:high mobility group nucleosome-binding domain-containing protein 5 [Drosophila tropicalis]|uniref:high mobility group nucleosome-binding domain-containing protein 5 n=1 Tax=Drosophila tropicalis TaxID=46794 RepID=UPI0035ABDFF2